MPRRPRGAELNATTAVGAGAVAGVLAGVLLWRWLRTGSYRRDGDEPRQALDRSWVAVPASGVAGAIAGTCPGWLSGAAWVYLIGGVAVTWIDVDVHRVPDRLLQLWTPLLGVCVVAAAAADRDWGMLTDAVVGGVALGGLFLVLALGGSMGLGDVKLAAVTGLLLGALGWPAFFTAVFAGFAAAALAAVWLLARGAARTSHLAFGPAIVIGAAVAILRLAAGT